MVKTWHPDINKTREAHARMQAINEVFALLMKQEFGILDIWEDYNRWWWRQYGNEPIWGNYYPEESTGEPGEKRTIPEKQASTGKD